MFVGNLNFPSAYFIAFPKNKF